MLVSCLVYSLEEYIASIFIPLSYLAYSLEEYVASIFIPVFYLAYSLTWKKGAIISSKTFVDF
jgi:hypothetical protein